jgi:hypothetical protein
MAAASLSDAYYIKLFSSSSSTPFGMRPSASRPFYNFTLFLSDSFFFSSSSFVRSFVVKSDPSVVDVVVQPFFVPPFFVLLSFAVVLAPFVCEGDLFWFASHLHPFFFFFFSAVNNNSR